jgi:hypothetical protein
MTFANDPRVSRWVGPHHNVVSRPVLERTCRKQPGISADTETAAGNIWEMYLAAGDECKYAASLEWSLPLAVRMSCDC